MIPVWLANNGTAYLWAAYEPEQGAPKMHALDYVGRRDKWMARCGVQLDVRYVSSSATTRRCARCVASLEAVHD